MNDVEDSPYHSFNSMKVLVWREWLEGMVTGKLLSPVTVTVDPSNVCNSDCIWCNTRMFRKENPGLITKEHLLDLADFFETWGIKSVTISGGGEPTLNPGTTDFIRRLKRNNIRIGIISNGIKLDTQQMEAIVDCCDWCGFSVDAGDQESYKKVHRVDKFNDVISNLQKLIDYKKQYNSSITVTYKFLLHPYNVDMIYEAASLAKNIGCNMFQVRPVCMDNLYKIPTSHIDFTNFLDVIDNQMEKTMGLNDENFRFFGIKHKFGTKFERIISFDKCRATPIMSVYCADGTVRICCVQKGKKEFLLCRHDDPYEILGVWGSKKHLDMIKGIDVNKCCSCPLIRYNEIIENVFIEDKMNRFFP